MAREKGGVVVVQLCAHVVLPPVIRRPVLLLEVHDHREIRPHPVVLRGEIHGVRFAPCGATEAAGGSSNLPDVLLEAVAAGIKGEAVDAAYEASVLHVRLGGRLLARDSPGV